MPVLRLSEFPLANISENLICQSSFDHLLLINALSNHSCSLVNRKDLFTSLSSLLCTPELEP